MRIKYTGTTEQVIVSPKLKNGRFFVRPGDLFDVDDEALAADLVRPGRPFEPADGLGTESTARKEVVRSVEKDQP